MPLKIRKFILGVYRIDTKKRKKRNKNKARQKKGKGKKQSKAKQTNKTKGKLVKRITLAELRENWKT